MLEHISSLEDKALAMLEFNSLVSSPLSSMQTSLHQDADELNFLGRMFFSVIHIWSLHINQLTSPRWVRTALCSIHRGWVRRGKGQIYAGWGDVHTSNWNTKVWKEEPMYAGWIKTWLSFPGGSVVKKICLPMQEKRFNPWVGKIPWRRKWQHTPVFLPKYFHRQRRLAGYSPWSCERVGHDLATKQQKQTSLRETSWRKMEGY